MVGLSDIIFFIGYMGFAFIPAIYVYYDAKSRGGNVWYSLLPFFLGLFGLLGWLIGRPKQLKKDKEAKKYKKIKHYMIFGFILSFIFFIGGMAMWANEPVEPLYVTGLYDYSESEIITVCERSCVEANETYTIAQEFEYQIDNINDMVCLCEDADYYIPVRVLFAWYSYEVDGATPVQLTVGEETVYYDPEKYGEEKEIRYEQ